MRIAVCDDEMQERQILLDLIHRYDSGLQVEAFSSASALQTAMASCFFDIIFMDIEMESPNGFEVARALTEAPGGEKPLIIFVTKSGDYTIRGYRQSCCSNGTAAGSHRSGQSRRKTKKAEPPFTGCDCVHWPATLIGACAADLRANPSGWICVFCRSAQGIHRRR